ncbi:MAG TPA: ABC transporter substrate-binding protein [Acidimicrobiia bacterium]|nr:ABC transporter substrate-binding protein [Acidimicrobiia bacterium]
MAATLAAPIAHGAPSVRGFSNGTITVAGMGFAANFDPDATTGATARFKRFNDDNEIKGIKIDYKEFADDNQDPAKSQTEATRLVRQVGVFAIVPDLSDTNPGAFLNSQHVPYFGWAFDNTYCSATPSQGKPLYGFGFNGCLVPSNPKRMPGTGADQLYAYVKQKTGKDHPTVALFSTDTQAGRDSTGFQASAYAGAGFDVVYSKGEIPTPPVADYTPYVQKLMTADNGKPPDMMVCLLATQCINMYTPIHTGGYNGTFFSALYDPRLASVFDGALLLSSAQPTQDPTPATEQMQKDVDAIKPGGQITSGVLAGYLSADFFIQALKKAGASPTPEKVQAAASTMTYTEKGLIGPTKYPASHVIPTPSCGAIVTSNGTDFSVVTPYGCSAKTYPVLKKYRA